MATTTNFGWETPDDTDLVKDGALAIRTLGNSIDTSLVDLKGGTTGQVLSKTSNTDMDFTWVTSDDANAIQNAIVDAKGDLITATAADTPARLAVGNNGETLVADSSASTGLRWQGIQAAGRNAFTNGAMEIWQRGTSFAGNTFNTYTADRWVGSRGTAAGSTFSRQTASLDGFQYCMRVARDSGNTATNIIYLSQSLESADSYRFAGKSVVLSFWARAGANFSAASSQIGVNLNSGTGTDQNVLNNYTGNASVISSNVTLTTSWQRFSLTGTVSSSATELALYTTFTPVGTAGAADHYEITGIQLELGSVATPFTRSGGTLAGERSACERYYWRTTADVQYLGVGTAKGTTTADFVIEYPTTMRTAPTLFANTGTTYFGFDSAAGLTNDSTIGNFYSPSNKRVLARITTSGLTTGQGGIAQTRNSAAYVEASAEL